MAEIPDWDTRILHSRWTNHQCGFHLCLMRVSCPSPEYKVIITYRWEKALGCPCHAQLDVRAALSLLSYLAESPPSMDPRPMHYCRYCSPPQGSRLSSTSNQSSSKPFPSSRVLQDSLTEQLQVLKAGLLTTDHTSLTHWLLLVCIYLHDHIVNASCFLHAGTESMVQPDILYLNPWHEVT